MNPTGVAAGSGSQVDPLPAEGGAAERVRSEPDAAAVALPWLFRFRWVVFAGQLLFVLAGQSWLGTPIADWALVSPALVLASNVAGLALVRRLEAEAIAAGLLMLDSVLLTALLAATGAAANPFTILYLVQIALSALVLRPRWTWAIAAASVLGFSALFWVSPGADPHAGHGMARSMASHLRGMWAAFVVAALATALFVTLLRRSLDRRVRELAALRNLATRYDRLATLSTFAAGAAHELATPLGTIALIATEAGARPGAAGVAPDLQTIRSEVERCRLILDDLAGRAGETAGEMAHPVRAGALIASALRRLAGEERSRVEVDSPADFQVEVPERALVRSLVTLLRNAFEASAPGSPVELRSERLGTTWKLSILDRGAGPREGLVERIGEPFLTTKEEGLGLGLFATRRLAELLGGELRLRARDGGGAVAELRLPVAARSAGDREAR